MFGLQGPPKYNGDCSCQDLNRGNQPMLKTTLSGGLTAAIMGWSYYCIVKDYDELAKLEATEEETP